MSEKQTQNQELKRKISLYTIIAVCLLVAGSASYLSAKRSITARNDSVKITASVPVSENLQTAADSRVNDNVGGIADDRTQAVSETTTAAPPETTTDKDFILRAESFVLPIDTQVLKNYSDSQIVYSKTTDDWRSHNGIDFSGNMGDPVAAVNNGIVTEVYSDSLWGTVVIIDHGDGLIAKYCGLGKGSTVKAGEKVKINQKIGNLSEVPIENADGIHLHFETTIDGMTVNPIIAMGMNENDFR